MSSKPRFVGEKVPFADAFTEVSRGTKKFKQSEYAEIGAHPIVDQGKEAIAGYSDEENGLFTDVPAIVFGDHTRCVKYVEEPFFAGADGVKILKPKLPGSTRFWWHALRATPIEDLGYSRHFKLLKAAKFKVINETRQEEVVACLDGVLEQISYAEDQLTGFDSLVKSRFIEMFGDLSGYESRTLKECVSGIESGKSSKCLAKPREGNNPGVLKLSAISSGIYKETENKALPSDAKATDGRVVCDGDILLARKNTPELVGQSVFVNHTDGNIMFPDIVFRMHAKYEVDGVYLSYALAHPLAGAIKSLAHGSAKSMSNIPKSELVRLPIPLPPLALQREFATFVSQVDKSRFIAQQQIEKLQMLYDSLAQDYFGD